MASVIYSHVLVHRFALVISLFEIIVIVSITTCMHCLFVSLQFNGSSGQLQELSRPPASSAPKGLRQIHYGYCSTRAPMAHVTDSHRFSHHFRWIHFMNVKKMLRVVPPQMLCSSVNTHPLQRLPGLLQLKLDSFVVLLNDLFRDKGKPCA